LSGNYQTTPFWENKLKQGKEVHFLLIMKKRTNLSKDTGEEYSSLGDLAFPPLSESAAWQDLHTLYTTFPNLGIGAFSFRHLLQ
jgi:hypothetical protein